MKQKSYWKNMEIEFKLRRWLPAASIGLTLLVAMPAFAANGGLSSFFGNQFIQQMSQGHDKPVPRGYIVPSATAIPGGAKIGVEIYHASLNMPVSLWLQAAVNDGNGKVQVVTIKQLSKSVIDNPTEYYAKREFDVNYAELNKELASVGGHAHLHIAPGTPLFVYAIYDTVGHIWGGVDRGGIVFMPDDGSGTSHQHGSTAAGRRAEELDIAYPINQNIAAPYNTDKNEGLKVGGQIRSRLESEGKFQIPLDQADAVKKQLFELANDPAKAQAVLGTEWTLTPELRYMQKDAAGKMLTDATGMPIPDPMVDTYYDNANFDAAKNDIAIRYRWTEGNASGAWNFKPGMTQSSPENIVDRLEYGVDTTDDKPETIAKFVDSHNPINPFREIRNMVPGSTPSDFLKPSVKITDSRFKFLMKHKSGLIIEVSLDDAVSTSLRAGKSGTSRYVQLEMDIDHLATQSKNTAQSVSAINASYAQMDIKISEPFLKGLDKNAFLDGRPVIHDMRDLDATSPVKKKHEGEFKLASEAIIALRSSVVGDAWLPGSQKYSLAAYALGLTDDATNGGSVKKLLKAEEKLRAGGNEISLITVSGADCGKAFD